MCSVGGANTGKIVQIVEEAYQPGMRVSLVARPHGIGVNQIFIWRRLMAQRALINAVAGEEVAPASEYRGLEAQMRELHRPLMGHRPAPRPRRRPPMRMPSWPPTSARSSPICQPTAIAGFMLCCAGWPNRTDRTRSVQSETRLLRHENARLLLTRDGERHEERRHVGRVTVDLRNNRWRSGLEITCDNGVKVVNRVPEPMEWLTDNPVLSEAEGGSCYNAHNTRAFVRGIELIPRTTLIGRPQSNGMAEAFVRIL